MADYTSALTGNQMDAALMDVAQHNSEAWAVGTRNGSAVSSGDATFNNNAKYYAESAYESAARASGSIPSGTAGAIFFDRAQSLTDAQKAQARANIAAANSNRNLLDNPWFRINQRNATSGSTGTYIADRWTTTYGSGGVTWSRTDETVTVQSTSGSSHGDIAQRMEKSLFDYLNGKTCTVSVMRSDYSIISKSFTFVSNASGQLIGNDLDGNQIFYRTYQASSYQDFQIWKWATAGTFRAVKLELGSYSTLINDTPPDYGEELAKCQRYFIRINSSAAWMIVGSGWFSGSSNVDFLIPTPVTMRAKPSASFTGTLSARGNSSERAITSLGVYALQPNGIYIESPITSGTANQACAVVLNAGYIDLSADL